MYEITEQVIQEIRNWIIKVSKELGYTEEQIKESNCLNNVYKNEKDILRLAYQNAWQLDKVINIIDDVLSARLPIVACGHGVPLAKYCKYCEIQFISSEERRKALKRIEMQKYYAKHTKAWNKYVSGWQKKHPEIGKRQWEKRHRNLGYIPLNKPFKGSVGHHIDFEFVVYILKNFTNQLDIQY